MNYNAVEMKRIGVDPTGWKWLNNNYSRYQVMDPSPTSYEMKQVARLKPGRFILFLAAFCAVIAGGTYLHPDKASIFPFIFFVVFMMVAFTAGVCLSQRRWVQVIGIVVISIIFIIDKAAMFIEIDPMLRLVCSLGMWSLGVALLFTRSLYFDGRVVERVNRLTGAELWSNPAQRVYGNPGGVASAVSKFGKEAVDAGVEGENRTASLLWLLLKIPGVTVFHGLKFPNSKRADVDHAVLHGSNVYLIDSKQYRWGEYEWRHHPKYGEQIARTDGYGRPKDNHMGAAAEGYREMLGHGVNVIPIIIVHGNKVKIGANKWSQSGVALFTPEEAMLFMGSTISHDLSAWRDNMYAREVLMKNIKV
jgi:hypothetical protein